MKDFDPADFFVKEAMRLVNVTNGEWTCSACDGTLGALETKTGWEVFVPNHCPTQQTCSNRVAELAEFALDLNKGAQA